MSANFILRETAANLRRHALSALVSMTTIAFCLLILGGSVIASMVMQRFTGGLLQKTAIAVFFQPETPREKITPLIERSKSIKGVGKLEFVPKERAWEEEKQKYGHLPELNGMKNPLGDEFRVTVAQPELSHSIARSLEKLPGVDKVREASVEVERLLRIERAIRLAGELVSAVLLLATAFVVGGSIRQGVFARRREILIMQRVGATDGFIRVPFLLEGVFHGAVGGLVACSLLAQFSSRMNEFLARTLPFLPLSTDGLPLGELYAGLLLTGVLLGLAGSYLSVRRHLLQGASA